MIIKRIENLIDKYNESRKHIFETTILGYFLTFVAGMMGMFTFKMCDGIYGNGLTGNLLFASSNFSDGNIDKMFRYILVIVSFSIGVIISHITRFIIKKFNHKFVYQETMMLCEMILLLIAYFVNDTILTHSLVTICLGIQIEFFDSLSGSTFSSVNYVGNTKNAADQVALFIETRDTKYGINALRYYGAFLFFFIGGAVANAIATKYEKNVVLFCAIVMFVILLYSEIAREKERK